MKIVRKVLFVSVGMMLFAASLSAQQTEIYLDKEAGYKAGLDLFSKQKYGAAQKLFEQALEDKTLALETQDNCAFYAAWCAALLFHREAEYLLVSYINTYPVSANRPRAVYELAKYFYQQKKYKKAIEWFEQTDPSMLSEEEYSEYYFDMGYALYKTNEYEKASQAFSKILDKDSKYNSAANYYYAHIAYLNKNYDVALKSFLKLKDSEAFAPVAPYYITQIYYKQGKYDEVLKYAPSKLDTGATRNGLEIERMIAEAHVVKGNYKEAIPYLVDYEKNSGGAGREDAYELGYCYYRTGEYDKAKTYFQKVIAGDDSLSQNAYYNLADCYLKSGDKRGARTAFQSAGKMNFDAQVKEEALFNYAKLSYELNYQSVAIQSFRNFLKEFPESRHEDEANELIVDVYSTTRNYKDALTAIETIRNKTPRIQAAYQKAAYYRGVEFMGNNNMADAVKSFRLAIDNGNDDKIEAAAQYWSGEAYYKMNDFDKAIEYYNTFLFNPAALSSPQYNLANYNAGYAYFKKEDYDKSQSAFRKYITDKKGTDTRRSNDALVRIADASFMMGNTTNAMTYYDQAIQNKSEASDYALYQKALILGIQGKLAEKITTLQRVFDKYPKSLYYDDALYEAATASLNLDKNEQALNYYKEIITKYSSGSYLKKAMLGEAQVYYNMQQDDRALSAFKNVISKYPNTPESREALDQVRNIYVNQNKTDEFLSYIKTVPNADVSLAAQDSLVYESAELRYTQGNCEKAVGDFKNYLERFPEGIYSVNANYYKSDCLFRNKQFEEALPGFEYVVSKPKSAFTEKSLLYAGLIQYRMNGFQKALEHFVELEQTAEVKDNILAAQAGQMRSQYKLNDYNKTIAAAQKVIASSNADKELVNEAHLLYGRSAFALDNFTDAKSELSIVAKRTNSEITAEAKYYLSLVEYKAGRYKESQKIVFEIAKQEPGYDYWIAKGFILLGDDYLALKDTFQAKETYKSILSNYEKDSRDPDDLRAVAKEKLDALTAPETIAPAVKPEEKSPEEPEEKQ
jgi:TolA-binding protein